MHLTCFSCFPR